MGGGASQSYNDGNGVGGRYEQIGHSGTGGGGRGAVGKGGLGGSKGG